MKVTIDRFEGQYAVCEKQDRTMVDILKDKLPLGIKEGDVLNIQGEIITFDTVETEKRKKHIEALTEDLWQ
jgi:aminoglycoside N3'-acetyltransferase